MQDSRQIALRAPELGDIDMLYRLERLPEVWRVTWGDGPVSRQMLWDYVSNYRGDVYADRQLRLVVTLGDVAIGTVDITDFDPTNGHAMLGIAIEPAYRRQGYGRQALLLAIGYCREHMSLHQLAAMVPRDNEASLGLFESVGFKTAGCLRSWLRRTPAYLDVILLQLML